MLSMGVILKWILIEKDNVVDMKCKWKAACLDPDGGYDAHEASVHDPCYRPHARVSQLGEVKDDEAVEKEWGSDSQGQPTFLLFSIGWEHRIVQLGWRLGNRDGCNNNVGSPL